MSFKQHEAKASTISSITKCFYKLLNPSCALACQKQRSICFWLELLVLLVQAKRTYTITRMIIKNGAM